MRNKLNSIYEMDSRLFVFLYFLSLSKGGGIYETYFDGFPHVSTGPNSWTSTRQYAGNYKLDCVIDMFETVPECQLFSDIRLASTIYSACVSRSSKGTPKELLIYEKPTKLFEEIPNPEKDVIEPFMICEVLSLAPKIPKNDFQNEKNFQPIFQNVNLTENQTYFEYENSIKEMTLNLTTTFGSNIEFFCNGSAVEEKEDCRWHKVTFYDGETWKLCSGWEKIFKTSKNNVLRVQMSFRIPVAVKCYARTTKDSNKEEIKLKIRQSPYRIENKDEIMFRDRTYQFSNDENARISAQCQMLQEEQPCGRNYIEISDGHDSKIFCGEQKLVFISKNGALKIRLRLDGEGKKYLCLVQAVTGPEANQWENLVSKIYPIDVATGPQVSTNCDCGRRYVPDVLKKLSASRSSNARIYNGQIAREGEYTWMVSIRDYSNRHRCGGSLITQRHVITAAHCAYELNSTRFLKTTVAIGSYRSGFYGESLDHQIIKVPNQNIFPHEKFKGMTTLEYDIAILFLEEPAKFGPKIGPVCLPKTYPDMVYREVFLTGWGLTEKQIADKLLLTKMFNIPSELCSLEENMICVYNNDTGACAGDSGGPFVLYDPEIDRFVQISFVSYGVTDGCWPGITAGTNLTSMYDWIEGIVKKTDKNAQICTKIN